MSIANALIEILSALIKLLLPGSMLFLLLSVTVGVALLLTGRGRRKGALAWLAALAIFYWLLSLPVVPRTVEGWLGAGYGPLATATQAEGAQHVVVLTGGGVTLRGLDGSFDILSTAGGYRLLEGERLYHLLGAPTLILSGGPAGEAGQGNPESEAMRAELVARGIPEDKIWLESEAPDTHQQAIRVGELLQSKGVDKFVLVTSKPHMRRALGAFADQGMRPIPSAAVEVQSPGELTPLMFLPSVDALNRSEMVFREIFALIYYSARGWMG